MPTLTTMGTGRYTRPDRGLPIEEQIRQEVQYWWNQYQYGRWGLEREWYRNILFYLGHQWIRYDEPSHRWRTENLQEWVPRPVTNRLASAVNTVRSAIMSADPRFSAEPRNPESDLAVSGSRAARDALDILYTDSLFRGAKRNMASWLVLTGTGFLGIEFNVSPEHGTIWIPGERCVTCGVTLPPSKIEDVCPQCQDRRWVEDGEAGESVPRGRQLTTAWSPFEVYYDSGVLHLEDQPALILSRSYHVEVARQAWPDHADRIKPTSSAGSAQYYLASLATASSTFRGVATPDHTQIRRFYRKPCADWEDGLSAILTSDGVVLDHDRKYPFTYLTTERPFFPLLRAYYDEVPARPWGKTPVSDLIYKQAQRNRIESMYEMALMTMAGPVWIIPSGSNPSKITGKPGIQITATPVSGIMPTRVQGMGPDAGVVQMLQLIDQDFEEIMSTFSVMKGKQPGGVRAFQAMRLLEERGMGRFGTVFENLEAMYEQWGTYSLELHRHFSVAPLSRVRRDDTGRWTQQQFLRADLSMDVDIRVESGSVRPKSSLSNLDALQRLQAMGAIDPRYPEQRMRMLEITGMSSMLPGTERDTEAAMRENAEFLQWAKTLTQGVFESQGPEELATLMGVTLPPVAISLLVDEHVHHFLYHRRFALTDDYRTLPEPFKRWWEDVHMAGHLDAYQQLLARGGVPGQLPPMLPQKPTIAPAKPLDTASQRM